MKDLLGNTINLPKVNDTVNVNGFNFKVTSIELDNDPCIVATINLKNRSGETFVGYYDYIKN